MIAVTKGIRKTNPKTKKKRKKEKVVNLRGGEQQKPATEIETANLAVCAGPCR